MTSRTALDDEPEFRPGVAQPPPQATRREFMRWFGASAAMTAIGGCGRTPNERRYPYNDTPTGLTPGIPQRYATAHVVGGFATGLVVQSREGRPLKVEGNPQHPASLGATGVLEQGMVLDVYDPRRLAELRHGEQPRGWEQLARALAPQRDRGRGLRLLLPPTGSPLRISLLDAIARELPEARWCTWEPSHPRAAAEAMRRIATQPLQPHYAFDRAARVLSLDADFMGQMPFSLRYAHDFATRRRIESASSEMNRMYMIEAKPSVTGSLADERLACKCSLVGVVAARILATLLGDDEARSPAGRSALQRLECPERLAEFARRAAADLSDHRGQSLIIVGDRQPWPVHVLGHALNEVLGNFGRTVVCSEPRLYEPEGTSISIEELTQQMARGQVQTLVIAGIDPVHALPPNLRFAEALARVETSVYWGAYPSATSRRCTWTVPARHPLESWGDAIAYDGTVTFQQPLIEPMGDAYTLDELLSLLLGRPHASARELLRELWTKRLPAVRGDEPSATEADAEPMSAFDLALQLGLIPNTGTSPVPAPAVSDAVLRDAAIELTARVPDERTLELALYESPCVHDGSYFHNAWLQELPDPITKQTWGNAWLLSPRTAARLGAVDGQVIVVRVGERAARAPVLIVPTHADDVVSTYLGYGQLYADRPHFDPLEQVPSTRVGFNAFALRSAIDQYFRADVEVSVTEAEVPIARTQDHFDMRDRPLALLASIEQLRERGELAEHLRGPARHLFMLPRPTSAPQWGMVIDQTVCTGCSACVVACQAENNVPVVGEVGVRQGREMHWLRIDRYYLPEGDGHRVVQQPMLCQHCEYAPCEYVCPVNATVHSPDGLNEMVYNRCIGTRFCSNNCPYKVRRFNWFDFVKHDQRMLQHNPEVTVRERGVMEKCTFCVQRIRNTAIAADLAGRELVDGEIQTACQQACPTRAIVFGDLSDRESTVSRWRARPHQYAALHDQGTSPRTRYLVKLVNPGPKVT